MHNIEGDALALRAEERVPTRQYWHKREKCFLGLLYPHNLHLNVYKNTQNVRLMS